MRFKIYLSVIVSLAVLALVGCASGVPSGPNEPDVISTIPSLPTTAAEQDEEEDVFADDEPGEAEPVSAPDAFSAPVTADGEVIVISGRVLDVNGEPVSGAAVEIWQTDGSGIYDHPDDPDTNNRDGGFQGYGTSVTGEDGEYRFRTLRPGEYEPRPPHIHVKIKLNGATVFITQLYFTESGNAGGLGAGADRLMVILEESVNAVAQRAGKFDFVIATGLGSGSLELTPSQAEGPYYPVVDVSEYDNDLVSVEE